MSACTQFKILQRRLKFRNPNHLVSLPDDFTFSRDELISAESYLEKLLKLGISWTYPGDINYPKQFLKMKEPPLFLEYNGKPLWKDNECLSIVGARKIHSLSEEWLKTQLVSFLEKKNICTVSGGAFGVDQLVHLISAKQGVGTIVIVPSGLVDLYPQNLHLHFQLCDPKLICFLSEFEIDQKLHKSHFFFRNRLIAALGAMTLLVQAEIKSGSLLTTHHALEIGRPVLTLPAHPMLKGFGGNIKLLQDGAYLVSSSLDLLEVWNGEIMSKNYIMTKD